MDPVEHGITSYDVAGLEAERVEDLSLRNVRVNWTSEVPSFFHAGIEAVDFQDLSTDGFVGSGPSDSTPAISLRNGVGVSITNARARRGKLLSRVNVSGTKPDLVH